MVIIALSSCRKKERIPWEHGEQFENKLSKNATVIDVNNIQSVVSHDSASLVFPLNSMGGSLTSGEYFVGSFSADFPNGTYRYIKSVDTIGANVFYTTRFADFGEIFDGNYNLKEIDFNKLFNINSNVRNNGTVVHKDTYADKYTSPTISFGNKDVIIEVEYTITEEKTVTYNETSVDTEDNGFIKTISHFEEGFQDVVALVKIEVVSGDNSLQLDTWEKVFLEFPQIPARLQAGPLSFDFQLFGKMELKKLAGAIEVEYGSHKTFNELYTQDEEWFYTPFNQNNLYTKYKHPKKVIHSNNSNPVPSWKVTGKAECEFQLNIGLKIAVGIGDSDILALIAFPHLNLKAGFVLGAGTGGVTLECFAELSIKSKFEINLFSFLEYLGMEPISLGEWTVNLTNAFDIIQFSGNVFGIDDPCKLVQIWTPSNGCLIKPYTNRVANPGNWNGFNVMIHKATSGELVGYFDGKMAYIPQGQNSMVFDLNSHFNEPCNFNGNCSQLNFYNGTPPEEAYIPQGDYFIVFSSQNNSFTLVSNTFSVTSADIGNCKTIPVNDFAGNNAWGLVAGYYSTTGC